MSKDYKRIQLLGTEDICTWWNKQQKKDEENGTKLAQEKLREAVRIGIEVMEGRLSTVSVEKAGIYEAIETLLRTGVIGSAPQQEKQEQKKEVKKPKLQRIRDGYEEHRK